MPRIRTENPELQALVKLQQIVAPLIARSISRDRKIVKSLKVLNSWESLTIEISQLFLYLSEEQALAEEDYRDFQEKLRNVLSLIDDWVDKDLLVTDKATESPSKAGEVPGDSVARREHKMLGYQRLEALVQRVADQEDCMDPDPLLHLPIRGEEPVRIERAVTDFNVSNFARLRTAAEQEDDDSGPVDLTHNTRLKVDNTKSDTDMKAVNESQAGTARLLKVLTDNLARSYGGCTHIARLQIRDPVRSEDIHKGLRHKLYISTCGPQDEWQEITCEVVSQRHESEASDMSVKRLRKVRNVCKTIANSYELGRKLDVLVGAKDLLRNPKQLELIKRPPLLPILSLEDVLEVGADHFMPADKIILAANLARALLRTYSSHTKLREMTAKDIYFLFDPSNEMVFEGHNPYLTCSLISPEDYEKVGVEEPEKQDDPSEFEKRKDRSNSTKNPMLVSFGKLLMEIALGRKTGPYDCRVDIALLAEIGPPHYSGQIVKMVGKPYVDVIIECLMANQSNVFDSDSDSDSDSGCDLNRDASDSCKLNGQDGAELSNLKKRKETEEELCRKTILAAVASLEKAQTIFVPQTCLNSPLQFRIRKPTQTRATSATIDKTGHRVTGEKSFDGVELKVESTDPRILYANEFFDSAQAFYESRLRLSPITEKHRVRIAVLDTGVDDTSNFWRGRSRIRKTKSSPLKEIKSFVGDSIQDELGHGTNVAALISKIAPEADLYIAKISRGREAEGTQQIIDAIVWAMEHGVHIVNMSFCLPRNPKNEKVRKKIEEATFNGMIFVAAASNCGNNESRGFPAKLLQVIGVHAFDGKGNKSGLNPPPKKDAKNFGSLGVAIESEWDANESYLEGTSYATPVITGMISNILRFVQFARMENFLTEDYHNEAFSTRGMSNILGDMAVHTADGYDYIPPRWKMWVETDTVQDVVTKIKLAMEKDMD